MHKPLVITGAGGQLGQAIERCGLSRGLDLVGLGRSELDISNRQAVFERLRHERPAAVINCAAYTAVDKAESEPDLANEINGTAVEHLAAACSELDATLIQLSTDYVFSGELPAGREAWRESDPIGPVSAYGRSKALGEAAARNCPEHLVLRVAWLYGHGGAHFVGAIGRQIDSGKRQLRVVADQTGSPTCCTDLAEVILDLAASDARGTLHVAAPDATTWHGLAVAIAEIRGAEVEIEAVGTEAFPLPAPRPSVSTLDASSLRTLLGRGLPPWRQQLEGFLQRERRCG